MATRKTAIPRKRVIEDEVEFRLAFDGAAVETGRMDAKTLAPSLFATAALVERAAELLYKRADALTVQVNADFKGGSFTFDLTAAAATLGQLVQNVKLADIKSLLESIGFVGKSAKSLLAIVLKHGDHPIERVEQSGTGNTNIYFRTGGDTQIIINAVPEAVSRLLQDPEIRKQAYEAISPLQKEGIDEFRIGSKEKPYLRILKQDVPKFFPPTAPKTKLADSSAQTAVELLQPSFVDGNKWRVAQGGEPFWVSITDPSFIIESTRVNSFQRATI
jgi:hypothetical protein